MKNMKKICAAVLALVLLLGLAACANRNVTTDGSNANADKGNYFTPIQETVDVNGECTVSANIKSDTLKKVGDDWTVDCEVYPVQHYNAEELAKVQVHDTIRIGEQDIWVTELETTENGFKINGGSANQGYDFVLAKNGTYRAIGEGGFAACAPQDTYTLKFTPAMVYVDGSDPEKDETYGDAEPFVKALESGKTFNVPNTTLYIVGGEIVKVYFAAKFNPNISLDGSNENAVKGNNIMPLPETIDVSGDCIVPANILKNTLKKTDDGWTVDCEIKTVQLYDAVEITQVKPNDTVHIDDQDIYVTEFTETKNGYALNGGLDKGGFDFVAAGGGTFCISGFDDYPSFTNQGVFTLSFKPTMTYTDSSDLEKKQPVTGTGEDFAKAIESGKNFTVTNTTLRIVAGEIVEASVIYNP